MRHGRKTLALFLGLLSTSLLANYHLLAIEAPKKPGVSMEPDEQVRKMAAHAEWHGNLGLLKDGDPLQEQIMDDQPLMSFLEANPDIRALLCGTFPLGLAGDSSDFDIVFQTSNLAQTEQALRKHFGTQPKFKLWHRKDRNAVVCSYMGGRSEVEIFASTQPLFLNPAWVHMIVEKRLLDLGGNDIKQQVLAAKLAGLKTEPAFAKALGLNTTDPFATLYTLAFATNDELLNLAQRP